MKPTINDVAMLSGYSKTTVSFAFNDPSRISRSAYVKILAAADELGYFPDPAARYLSMRRIGSIGFLTPYGVQASFLNPYTVEIFRGVSATMQSHGISVTVVSVAQDVIVEAIRNAAVGGFISLGLQPGEYVHNLILRRRIPFVTVDAGPIEGISSVNIRDRQAAREQIGLALQYGHYRIGVISTEHPEDSAEITASDIYSQRIIGYNLALLEAGLPPVGSVDIPFIQSSATIADGFRAAKFLLKENPQITAMLSMSDVVTAGIYLACEELGRAIPQDISIVGFDDIPCNRLLCPALTTISQPGFRKGETAANLLLENIENTDNYAHRMLSYNVFHGASLTHSPVS